MSKADNIFLIGPMGAGKTTIGRQLAQALHKSFVDADHEIESHTGVSIPTIFDIEGEDGFRNRESQAIAELCQGHNIVLATGGGAVLRAANRAALSAHGTVVYLRADLETLFERTRRDRHRPLLQTPDPHGKIEALLREREPLYLELADIVVDTGSRPPASVARDVINRLKQQPDDADPEA